MTNANTITTSTAVRAVVRFAFLVLAIFASIMLVGFIASSVILTLMVSVTATALWAALVYHKKI